MTLWIWTKGGTNMTTRFARARVTTQGQHSLASWKLLVFLSRNQGTRWPPWRCADHDGHACVGSGTKQTEKTI